MSESLQLGYSLVEDRLEMIEIPQLTDLLVEEQLLLQIAMSHSPQGLMEVQQFHLLIAQASSDS